MTRFRSTHEQMRLRQYMKWLQPIYLKVNVDCRLFSWILFWFRLILFVNVAQLRQSSIGEKLQREVISLFCTVTKTDWKEARVYLKC